MSKKRVLRELFLTRRETTVSVAGSSATEEHVPQETRPRLQCAIKQFALFDLFFLSVRATSCLGLVDLPGDGGHVHSTSSWSGGRSRLRSL